MAEPDLLTDKQSLLLVDIGGWMVGLMRIDDALVMVETIYNLELGDALHRRGLGADPIRSRSFVSPTSRLNRF